MEKIVSQLSADGYFIGAALADESPLEPGVFLIPSGAIIRLPPHEIRPGKRYKPAVGGGWSEEDIPKPTPEPEQPEEAQKVLSVREFRQRFTLAEQVAIRAASFSDMEVGLTYDEFLSAQFIDVTDPATAAGVDLYISKGLLLGERRDELLAIGSEESSGSAMA